MKTSIEHPYTPVSLTADTAEAFALAPLAAQLTSDKAYREHGRAGLTLVRGEALTLVLTAVQAGKISDVLTTEGPTALMVLSGALTICLEESAESIHLDSGTVVTLAPQVCHTVEASDESVFLTVIGEQPDLKTAAGAA
ncbi:MAG: hypothetical protein AB7N91_27400 [Candidatus Tectimicrobiota bacterium]